MRIFIDGTVLFSAAHDPNGKAAFIIELGAAGYYLLFTSDAALEEAKRNIAVKYPDCLSYLDELIPHITFSVADLTTHFPVGLSQKDAVIFQAAVACQATHFLTSDLRHFGSFMNQPHLTKSIIFQTVSEFIIDL